MPRLAPLLLALTVLAPAAAAAAGQPGGTVAGSAVDASAVRGFWPTGAAVPVARAFDPPPQPWLAGHRGVDLLVAPGQVVRAPLSGTVAVAAFVVDRPVLVVASGRFRVSLEPVASDLAPGTAVTAGEPVGVVAAGRSHCPPRACLHWGLRVDGQYRDPLLLVRSYRAVLLPRAGRRRAPRHRPTTRSAG